jgi:hypothetical protein
MITPGFLLSVKMLQHFNKTFAGRREQGAEGACIRLAAIRAFDFIRRYNSERFFAAGTDRKLRKIS